MDAFRCLRLSVLAQTKDPIRLPHYQGSALRGAFGYAMKRCMCVTINQKCTDCMLKDRSVYCYAFETPPPPDTEVLRKCTSVPHPFVLNPATGETGFYEPGMSL